MSQDGTNHTKFSCVTGFVRMPACVTLLFRKCTAFWQTNQCEKVHFILFNVPLCSSNIKGIYKINKLYLKIIYEIKGNVTKEEQFPLLEHT